MFKMKRKSIYILVSLLISIVLINLPFLISSYMIGCDSVNCTETIKKDSLCSSYLKNYNQSFIEFFISSLFLFLLILSPILYFFKNYKSCLIITIIIILILLAIFSNIFNDILYGFYLIFAQQALLLVFTVKKLYFKTKSS